MVDHLPVTCQNGNHKEKKEKHPLYALEAFTNRRDSKPTTTPSTISYLKSY